MEERFDDFYVTHDQLDHASPNFVRAYFSYRRLIQNYHFFVFDGILDLFDAVGQMRLCQSKIDPDFKGSKIRVNNYFRTLRSDV